ncbi:uncharacterized protein LOC116403367 isoform X2 [Cucumis sativus]|uniref:uncharacterized protein LOC116403367 isoform X2 n=1 Tax=Cucumis sativus TaxID=3659 RepID=UPI0012F4E0BA|nr:uncharacterized protein LOC116403367 isoform X2 [Cucumis sativus]
MHRQQESQRTQSQKRHKSMNLNGRKGCRGMSEIRIQNPGPNLGPGVLQLPLWCSRSSPLPCWLKLSLECGARSQRTVSCVRRLSTIVIRFQNICTQRNPTKVQAQGKMFPVYDN